MTYLETKQNLWDHLFHGIRKHICNSTWYLDSTPHLSYSQLMVATQKAKSKTKEIQDCVRTNAAVTSELAEGMVELKQQITQLMTALTQVGYGSSNNNSPSSPQECGHGCRQSARSNNSQPNLQTRNIGHMQLAQPHSLLREDAGSHSSEWVAEVQMGTKNQVHRETVQPTVKTHSHSSATYARDGATWPKSALHWHSL